MNSYNRGAESAETLYTLSKPLSGTRGPQAGHRAGRMSGSQKTTTNMWDLAIWTYQTQKAHRDSGRVGGIGYGSMSQTGAVLERSRLGCSISGGGGLSRTYCDDDALSVHEMVLRLRGEERALVIRTASVAVQPGWQPRIPLYRCVPVKGRKGAHKGIYDKHGNQIGCELAYEGFSPVRAAVEIDHARDVYRRWYSALAVLRDALGSLDELRRWVVTGVGAEPTPWAA
ncbi:MAG: hypothetical protein SV862_00280 [Pseudomonadota bacterium]|nr:hypothetical protein [Pseudomonadota bacterium]